MQLYRSLIVKEQPSEKSRAETPALTIIEQPTRNVIANKYLEPPIQVKVNDSYISLAREGKLQVTASLCGSLSEEIINRTIDGKQNILQGFTNIPVTAEGSATFSKLKIMDVSSKHHHQSFSIQIQLQVKKNDTFVNLGEPVKSASLHVQSRLNHKRKTTTSTSQETPKKKLRTDTDTNYIDITSLLVLPQKEAASKLGISESMLCKRFKECTRRKWPYRYLRKIEKILRIYSNQLPENLSQEDKDKITQLQKEREECLQPVKIRISGTDKHPSSRNTTKSKKTNNHNNDNLKLLSDTDSDNTSDLTPEDLEDLEEEIEEIDDEISMVVKTLNSFKQTTQTTH